MQAQLLDEISRSIIYARNMEGQKSDSEVFIKSSLYKQSIIVWCQIFGNRSEDLHWCNIVNKQNFITEFNRDIILQETKLTLKQWGSYHQTMKTLRDKFFAHFDIDNLSVQMPSLDIALQVTELYRDWLYSLLLEVMKTDSTIQIGFDKTTELNKRIESELSSW